jgi:NAD(P)-dependent dehydrogenase (short-subunit alcohol dehydrogenase family)
MADAATVVIGGTSGIGRHTALALARRGEHVIVTGRDAARAQAVADEIGGGTRGLGFDLTAPHTIAAALEPVGAVRHLVVAAIERDENVVRRLDLARATRLVTIKLVGYPAVVQALAQRLTPDAAIVLFGGLAKERPYPGSTMVTTVNGGVQGLVKTLAVELAPIRVNAVHPGIVGDTANWQGKPPEVLQRVIARTPVGRLVTMDDVVGAVLFLLDNQGLNGVNLQVDGG